MKDYEADLQEQAERPTADDAATSYTDDQGRDLALYRQLFDALKEEPAFRVSPDFASRLAAKVQRRRKTVLVEWIEWLPAVATVVLGVIGIALLQPSRVLFVETGADVIDLLSVLPVRAVAVGAAGIFLLDRVLIWRGSAPRL